MTDVGVVGIGCRFPGADTPEELWGMISRGEHAVRPFPPDRLAARFHDPAPGTPGRSAIRAGALLDDVERFDHRLFGIPPREAQFMDPMQRILLEVTWHALEDAGLDPRSLAGSRTGVFVGSYAPDFTVLQAVGPRFPEDLAPQAGPNVLHSMASGRVAHAFDLMGPAATLDTACSSSLVALHLAVRSLRAGDCDRAIVGGVNLALSPDSWVNLSQARMASPDGRSKGFSADADGYGRGEGCGVLVLEPTDVSAERGARVRALVRGTASNHDGRSSTMLSPSRDAQVAVARAALADAGIRPADVAVVEAHGTGTPTGDPIELAALAEVYGAARTDGPLLVGSVKSNLNHTEAASGVAGAIKSVLALEQGAVPPHLLVGRPTTAVDLDAANLRLATGAESWPDGRRIVGINSFGLSGTNAHVLLEAAPAAPAAAGTGAAGPEVVVLSSGTEDGLRTLAAGWADAAEAGAGLHDLAHTARTARADLEHRAAVVAEDVPAATRALRALAAGESDPGTRTGRVRGAAPVVLCFSGQGSQRAGAGAALYAEGGVFAAELDAAVAAFDGLLDDVLGADGPSLLDVVLDRGRAGGLIDSTEVTQPALFVLEIATARTLEAQGVAPAAVVGHSIGAFAAAVVAGHLDLGAAARLVAARGRLMRDTPAGAMTAVVGPADAVADALGSLPAEVEVAARNAPGAVTLSGPVERVAEAEAALADVGDVMVHRLAVGHAFHSAAMAPVADELRRLVEQTPRGVGRIPFASDVDGHVVAPGESLPADHWSRQVRQTVRFEDAVRAVSDGERRLFVEVGPGGVLVRLARRVLGEGRAPGVATLPETAAPGSEADLRAALFAAGALPGTATARAGAGAGARLVAGPRYPFAGTALMSPTVADNLARLAERPGRSTHAAGGRVALPDGAWAFGSVVGPDDVLLADHALFGAVVVPGAYWLSLVAQAALHLAEESRDDVGRVVLSDVVFAEPLVPAGGTHDVTVRLDPDDDGGWTFEVTSRSRGGSTGTRHASGAVRVAAGLDGAVLGDVRADGAGRTVSRADFYREMRRRGVELGARFQAVRGVEGTRGGAVGTLSRPASDGPAHHPGLLDAFFQVIAAALPQEVLDRLGDRGTVLVPVGVDEIVLAADGLQGGPVAVTEVRPEPGRVRADVAVGDEARLRGVVLGEIHPALLGLRPTEQRLAYDVAWEPVPADDPVEGSVPGDGARRVGIVGDGGADHAVLTRTVAQLTQPTQAGVPASGVVRDLVASSGSVALPPDLTDLLLDVAAGRPGWSGGDGGGDGDGLLRATVDACALLVDVVRQAADHGTRVWVLGRGTDDPVTAAVAGLARTLAAEHPGVFGAVVHLVTRDEATVGAALRRTLLAEQPDPQVLVADGVVHRPALRPAASGGVPPAVTGTWVVTGGSGALARHTARHLLARGATHVALLSRSAPDPEVLTELGAAHHGTPVQHRRADVGDRAALDAALDAVRAEHGPLHGVVHAAGVLADGPVLDVGRDDLATVLQPKTAGAAHLLDALEPDAELVLYSSVAGVLGTPLQGAYAAANASLDALARSARAAGRRVTSVAWGPWSGAGMVATGSSEAVVDRVGMQPLAPDDALGELEAARGAGAACRVVVDADWSGVASALGGPVVRGLTGAVAARAVADVESGEPVGPVDADAVLDLLVDAVADATRVPADAVDVDGPLASLGVDSITTIDLRARLADATGVHVPVSLLLGRTTLRGIAEHVLGESGSRAAGSGGSSDGGDPVAVDDPTATLARLDELTDSEVEAALAALEKEQEDAR